MSGEPKRSKDRRVTYALVTLGWAIISLGCRYSPPHPPGFADYRRLGPGLLEDTKKLSAQVALFEAAQFLPQEIETIRSKGDPRELIGAALQSKVGSGHIGTLLREAVSGGSNDPVVLAGVALSLVHAQANGIEVASGALPLAPVLNALERLEPGNGLPQIVRAYVQMKQGDTNAARLSLISATQKPALQLHSSELRLCVVQAALTVRYPRYTAYMLGLGTLGFSTEIAFIGKGLLNDPQVDQATVEACLELSRRHEAQATLFIDQLIAISLQKLALESLKSPGYENELQRMKNKKEKIMKAIVFLDSPKAHTTSERDGLRYFETLFQKSEFEAVNELPRKLNFKL